ncbi:MAG: 4-alpha-glucanotransferase [Luteitalea sp.]|nr:4-alpha-glucanotransferase [Luteitalea sp.]
MSTRAGRRRAGLLMPLFSCPSSTSWGIGDIGDIGPATEWLRQAGLRVLQLLPLNEMASGQQSPYSAISAMAVDPIFIRVQDVPEFAAAGGPARFTTSERRLLDRARRAPRIDFAAVRRVKQAALGAAFEWFDRHEWRRDTERARELGAFVNRESWWLDDYSLFRALHEREQRRPWTEWPDTLRQRQPQALAEARRALAREIRYYQYLQWLADTQWRQARAAATRNGVELFGDLPFMVDGDSADVWARQDEFRLDASVGVPPDAFSATGQDWGMPPYRWDVIARTEFEWLRHRARRSAALYHGYRVDHLVGFYRTYARPRGGGGASFSPEREDDQLALGERALGIFREPGAEIIAEDLGIVPDFVRASLLRLGVPGFRVFRWERNWDQPLHPFRDVSDYPSFSVAASGTHDTEPLAVWWENAEPAERQAVAALPTVVALAGRRRVEDLPYNPIVRDLLLEALFASTSELLLVTIQDVFGWRDRINEPATVNERNWTFRLPWPVDTLAAQTDVRERTGTLRAWSEKYDRLGTGVGAAERIAVVAGG